MTASVSRRQLAKGAAWSVPVVAAASAVPAMAVSHDRSQPYGSICNLAFGTGTINAQRTIVRLSVKDAFDAEMVPAGTKITWVVNLSDGEIPTLNYSRNDRWALSVSGEKGEKVKSFTVTMTVNRDTSVASLDCIGALLWDNTNSKTTAHVTPQSTISVSSPNDPDKSGLSFRVPQRWGTSVNDSRRKPLVFLGSSDNCYPQIQWTNNGNASNLNKDNITDYPQKKGVIPNSNAGNDQKITTARCF